MGLLDADGDGRILVSDPVALLTLLFVDSSIQLHGCIGPGVEGCKCIPIQGCPEPPDEALLHCPP